MRSSDHAAPALPVGEFAFLLVTEGNAEVGLQVSEDDLNDLSDHLDVAAAVSADHQRRQLQPLRQKYHALFLKVATLNGEGIRTGHLAKFTGELDDGANRDVIESLDVTAASYLGRARRRVRASRSGAVRIRRSGRSRLSPHDFTCPTDLDVIFAVVASNEAKGKDCEGYR